LWHVITALESDSIPNNIEFSSGKRICLSIFLLSVIMGRDFPFIR